MNPLEKEVPSLETCRKLNWKGKTIYVWVRMSTTDKWEIYETTWVEKYLRPKCNFEIIKAPTPTEMLERLPCALNKDKKRYDFVLLKGTEKYLAKYQHGYFLNSRQDYVYTDLLVGFTHKSPAEALSKLCLWCKEEGYLK